MTGAELALTLRALASFADLFQLPERAVRRRCQACGHEWIARLPACPRCQEDRALSLPMRRVGWVPSEAGPDQLEFYSFSGAYLGAVVYRKSTWSAFAPSGPVGEHPLLEVAQRQLEEACRFVRPALGRCRWVEEDPLPRARVTLVGEDGLVAGCVICRTGRWWVLLGDEALCVAERESLEAARRWLEELLGLAADATSA